ncbi:MAG: hypothetical protein HY689_06000 [Chloroflexi bacterium]|nr:hypothetical protein [Chloroflexota bacterium]
MKTPVSNSTINLLLASQRIAPRYVASFDSASAMLRALGRFLRGHDFPVLGLFPGWIAPMLEPVAAAINALPNHIREAIYIRSSAGEGIPQADTGLVRAEALSRWVVSEYPRRRYPAAMIGSSNGAGIHLCAALGIPWLPQTFLVPVQRSGVHPDEPQQDLALMDRSARALLAANPDLQLHHMHDPSQDRLTIQGMTYFRIKRRNLGETYERFLEETLEPGATLFLIECGLSWPTTQVDDRYLFQFGALGGPTTQEYFCGGPRVEDYLRRYQSYRRRWDPPPPNGDRPEAEWGFEPTLREDVERLARRRGYRIRRIIFEQPEDLSPLVADLYRWWYRQRGLHPNRLLVESFIVMEPWWALRTASAPFWMVFNTQPSADGLERYLEQTDPFDEIRMMLFSHGTDGIGVTPIARWRSLLRRARVQGSFVGMDEPAYPRDFATFVRYNRDLQRTIAARYPLPGPLALRQLDAFLEQTGDRYPVRWIVEPGQDTDVQQRAA